MSQSELSPNRDVVVVTGVSSGIGRATVDTLLSQGRQVFGSVRSQADADRLTADLGAAGFTPLLFDVTDEIAIAAAVQTVDAALQGGTLAGLVNSAGIALSGPLLHQSPADFAKQIAVNVTGPFLVTRAFAPLLGTDRSRTGAAGRIVIVSSISGRLATPFLGAYAASKHAVEGYAETLRRELMMFGIDVIVVAPGAVQTPIWDKAEQQDVGPYQGTRYAQAFDRFQRYMVSNGRRGLVPEQVGRVIAAALVDPRPRAHQPVVKGRFTNWTLPRAMPRRVLDRVLARRLGLLDR